MVMVGGACYRLDTLQCFLCVALRDIWPVLEGQGHRDRDEGQSSAPHLRSDLGGA